MSQRLVELTASDSHHEDRRHDAYMTLHPYDGQDFIIRNLVYIYIAKKSRTWSHQKIPNMSSSDTEFLNKSLTDGGEGGEQKSESLDKYLGDSGEQEELRPKSPDKSLSDSGEREEQKSEVKDISTKEEPTSKDHREAACGRKRSCHSHLHYRE